jgi:hypothetical protein
MSDETVSRCSRRDQWNLSNRLDGGAICRIPRPVSGGLAEGVINLKVHLGLGVGRAFCVNLAPDADAVRRAHERVGLPFDTITEVSDISAFATAA